MFKNLYSGNSTREPSTLKYFREKLNRKNVSADLKHLEGCEQLFLSVGRCYLIELDLHFFDMKDTKDTRRKNRPNYGFLDNEGYKERYFNETMDAFLNENIFSDLLRFSQVFS